MNNYYSVVLTKYDDFFELFITRYLQTIDTELVVIDDGLSTQIKNKYDNLIYIDSSQPFAWCLANNIGMKYDMSKDVLLLQDDWLIMTNNLGKKMQRIAYSDATIGTVVSLMDNVMNPEMHPENKVDTEYVITYRDAPPMFVKRDVINTIGFFDENFRFGIAGYEDNDYSKRLRQAGYKIAIAQNCFIQHGGEQFGRKHSNTRARAGIMDSSVNQRYYHKKWSDKITQ